MIRFIKHYVFLILQVLLHIVDFIKFTLKDGSSKLQHYETSAQVSNILWRHKPDVGINDYLIGKNDFLCIHETFTHPSIILNENVTLYTVTKDEAIFVDCGDINMFGLDVSFIFVSQYQNALKLISMPIESFHLISSQISFPKVPIVHMSNHGRCGSTLMYRIFQAIPNTLSMSEPYSFVALADFSRSGKTSQKDLRKLCLSVLKCTMKHGNERKSDLICLDTWHTIVYCLDIFCNVAPFIKQIYQYRQPLPFVQSWEKLSVLHSWPDIRLDILKARCGIGHNKLLSKYPIYTNEYLKSLSSFGRWALHWIACNAAYNNVVDKEYPIVSIKYEDFIKNPEDIITSVFDYIGISHSKLPDLKKILSRDSQAGSVYTSRNADQKKLKDQLTPITQELKKEIDAMCNEYDVPLFWDNVIYLGNNIKDRVKSKDF